MKFGGRKYDIQFTNTEFMHGIQKIDVDVAFIVMTAKKGIKRHGELAVKYMYKE